MFSQTQLAVMVRMQDELNSKINPNWKDKNEADFMLAASLEMGEAIEHYGWKWWKKQTPDLNQVRMELVDVWHFALSDIIRTAHQDKIPFEHYLVLGDFDLKFELEPIPAMRWLMGALCDDFFNAGLFKSICDHVELSGDQLFKLYVGKNVLNTFRQNNGYKDGTYIKEWSGKEDNEYLTEIMDKTDINSPTIDEDVYAALTAAYHVYA
jgi:dimeric dUTPase (all-alpha-NTP-PPase superfamily)